MSNDTLRLIFFALLGLSLLILFKNWEEYQSAELDRVGDAPALYGADSDSATSSAAPDLPDAPPAADSDVPQITQPLTDAPDTAGDAPAAPSERRAGADETVTVETDWLIASFSRRGGDLVEARLKKHLLNGRPLPLMERGNRFYISQSGLIGDDAIPNHNSDFTLQGSAAPQFASGQASLTITFVSRGGDIELTKQYILPRAGYVIDINTQARNIGGDRSERLFAYYQIAHDTLPPRDYSSFLPTFFGAAVYTADDKFVKVDLDDPDTSYPRKSDNGWIGVIQRYFAALWLPDAGEREFFIRRGRDGNTRVGFIAPMGEVAASGAESVRTRLFVGAQEQDELERLQEEDGYEGIGLVVDYGWLTFIAILLFQALSFIESYIGNWGVAIILLTVLIKLLFYPLSSAAYRSMAKMKEEAPNIKQMQERFGDDKQRLQKEMMALYRKKKINPLGGCLPILVQIPVFIALYWVLLGSVELRQAPFALWISDLATPDPYYILSLIMGGAMFLQTRLSPAPPDPTQAMIMKIMPIGFALFSVLFPSGLVLYWAVNTILSIAQQWWITRRIAAASAAAKK